MLTLNQISILIFFNLYMKVLFYSYKNKFQFSIEIYVKSRGLVLASPPLGTAHLTWRGGYGFLFRSEFFFRQHEILFFLSRKARFFFPEFNNRLYDKNSESDYFFSFTKIRIFVSATLGIIIILERNHNPASNLFYSTRCLQQQRHQLPRNPLQRRL